ncbi:hypothetical protein [Pseudoalteromonas sp. MMG012]|uniref:hypothetical protein n=1 Tax=Pseudoalteromonas sp. MMG012 TaxID=2822686 RepID=UPI001B39F2F0|nr:hypothetical protein [Pseudoalteromonas sp. MMG012]MBQ4849179.1 hypothetical protein [Pseudoalteromonas sp. MMG012]
MKALLSVVLLAIIFGLILPHQYQVTQSRTIQTQNTSDVNLLLDLKNWPAIMAWHTYSGLTSPKISTPSTGIGAHIKLEHTIGYLEITIVEQTTNRMAFSVLINDEHTGYGKLTITPTGSSTKIEWYLNGTIHSSILGGYMALYCEFFLKQMIISATNNLNSQLKLQADP